MKAAYLLGREPDTDLGYTYTEGEPFDSVVIGSLSLSQALRFADERVLTALSQGKPVILYIPGLPDPGSNRALSASLSAAYREMKGWGILFTDGGQKKLITAEAARQLRLAGKKPAPGAVLTPLAREILEGTV